MNVESRLPFSVKNTTAKTVVSRWFLPSLHVIWTFNILMRDFSPLGCVVCGNCSENRHEIPKFGFNKYEAKECGLVIDPYRSY